jgi:hypothetical protein
MAGSEAANTVEACELRALGDPIVAFSSSHSGSRFLARILSKSGVFIGAHLNGDSEDSLDVFRLLDYVARVHLPDLRCATQGGDPELVPLAREVFAAHLQGWTPGTPWGWKLCEVGQILPVIHWLFPNARYIHLIRDGRDVALSPFLAPKNPPWRQLYFGTDRVTSCHALPLTQRAYRRKAYLFNAARWVNGVTLGRAHGLMAGYRYLEVRYEDLVGNFEQTVATIARFIGMSLPDQVLASLAAQASKSRIGKWRNLPARELEELHYVLEPTLSCFGYGTEQAPVRRPRLSALQRLLWS